MAGEDVERSEVEALLATRRELGAEYDAALVASFADRVEQAVAARARAGQQHAGALDRQRSAAQLRQFVLGVCSVVAGIPITIVPMVAADNGLPGVVLGWVGILGVNVAHAAVVAGPRRDRRT